MTVRFDELRVLKVAEGVADELWKIVLEWDDYTKDTVGKQLVRAADSIGANIAEAYGRYHYGEKLQFLYYSRGSLFETKYWINRAFERQILSATDFHDLAEKLSTLAHDLNAFAKSLKDRKKGEKLREPSSEYKIGQESSYNIEGIELFSPDDLDALFQFPNSTNNHQSPITNHPKNRNG